MSHRLALPLVFVCGLLIAGCGSLPTPPSENPVSTYRLAPAVPTGDAGQRQRAAIAVSHPTASPAFSTPGIAYQQRDFEVRYYASNEWLAAPADMLERVVLDALHASGRFEAVLGDADSRLAARRLDIDIRELTHDLRVTPATARVTLRAQLIDAERGRLVASEEFSHVQTLAGNGPYAGVQGINGALSVLLPELVEFAAQR